MTRLVCLAFLALGAVAAAAPVELQKTTAEPGAVPAEVVSGPAGSRIRNWRSATTEKAEPGVFTLEFARPLRDATVIAYDGGESSFRLGKEWVPQPGRENFHLQTLRLDRAAEPVAAVRFQTAPRLQPSAGGRASYRAELPFALVLDFAADNLAPDALVTVSSAAPPSEGFQPRPWQNRPATLVDGFLADSGNFATAPRQTDLTAEAPEWLLLSWDQEQTLRAVGHLRARNEKGFGQLVTEIYTGTGDPRFSTDPGDWRPLTGEWRQAAPDFYHFELLKLAEPVRTRGLRFRSTGGVRQLEVGELLALGDAAARKAPTAAGAVPIRFRIPDAGKVTIQIRDAEGRVVANPVTGVPFTAGEHTVNWNLDDVLGKPVLKPGEYTWHGLYTPPLEVAYRYTYYPTPLKQVAWQTPDRKGGWLADHEPPRTICRGSNGTMWLGAFAEAGDSIVHVDNDFNKLWGINRVWVAIPSEICTDGDFYYGLCEGGWIGDTQVIIQIDQNNHRERKIFQRPIPKEGETGDDPTLRRGITGFQVVGNRAFLSFGGDDRIQVFDLTRNLAGENRNFSWATAYRQFEDQKPTLIKELTLPSPGRLRRFGDGKLLTTSGKDLVTIDLKSYAVEPLARGVLNHPLGLGVDPERGRIYVGEGEPRHQVVIFDAAGKELGAFGKPGRREVGPYDEHDLEEPYGVEVDDRGRVWVMEHTNYVKRVSVWDPDRGRCLQAIVGPTEYGGGGCIDPADENRLFYGGLEFHRNPETGEIKIVNLIYRPDSKRYATFAEDDRPSYAFRTDDGRLWFTSNMHPHEHGTIVLWEYQQDHVMPVAAIGSAYALRVPFGEGMYRKGAPDWTDTSMLKKHIPGYQEDQKFFTWTDRNADGFIQPEELRFGKLTDPSGKLLTKAGAGWLWRMNRSFETAAHAGNNRMIFFKPESFTDRGYPVYAVPDRTVAGYGEAFMPDSQGNVIVLGGPMSSVAPDGTVNWIYRNDWPGLHAGHKTTARGDEPGVLIAPTRIWGIVPVNEELGEVVAFNSNLGCTYLMTTRDGLYIDRIFRDQRVGLLWNFTAPPTPEVLAETSTYDEHFGGTLQKVRGNDGRDHYYYVCGKNHCSVVELTGLDRIRRLAGGKLQVSPEAIAAAELRRQQEARRVTPPKSYLVPRVADGSIKIDGSDAEWAPERIDGFALAYDRDKLYVYYSGNDDRATFQNHGTNPLELFKTGDVLDVMLQTKAGLPPERTSAGEGDLRISFAMFNGKPVCVVYDFVVPGFKGESIPFSSPWRTIWCNRAGILDSAEICVKREGTRVRLEAAIPLKDIHFDPAALGECAGDVGRVLSDQSGTQVSSRVYWSNQNTHIMSDLPSEAALQPNLWGRFRFER